MTEFTQSFGFIVGVLVIALTVSMIFGPAFLYASLWLILGSMILLNQDKLFGPLRRE